MADPIVRDALLAGREVLQERGWGKGFYENSLGCVCALGALRIAVFGGVDIPDSASEEAWRAYIRAERLFEDDLRGSVITFNDQRSTRETDVYALYERAIKATA
jgi:hypothetical protein